MSEKITVKFEDARATTIVYATEINPYVKAGEPMKMGLAAAEISVKKGFATTTKPKGK